MKTIGDIFYIKNLLHQAFYKYTHPKLTLFDNKKISPYKTDLRNITIHIV